MTTPITRIEWNTLRKLANRALKHVRNIGGCDETETTLEQSELQALIETATELLNTTNEIKYIHS